MRRALELAKNGSGFVSPNPMVGAVIVAPDHRIIGEGWHRVFGGPHAEVNAFNSVKEEDRYLIKDSTIYITLEPCSHHGKTPPCADLLVRERFSKAVIATSDPFARVNGEGIRRMTEAGIEVTAGVLEKEARELNKTFFYAHSNGRPYVTLKWAQSSDGWMDSKSCHPYKFSVPLSRLAVHKLRALNDAIITSTYTAIKDNPHLDIRLLDSGKAPRPVVIGESALSKNLNLTANTQLLTYRTHDINQVLEDLYRNHNIISVLVEGGPRFLKEFINKNLWNEARIEVSPIYLGDDGCFKSPVISSQPVRCDRIEDNNIYWYKNE